MTPVGTWWLLSHPDVLEECILTEGEYEALVGGYDFPPNATVIQLSLVPLDEFLAAVRVAEP